MFETLLARRIDICAVLASILSLALASPARAEIQFQDLGGTSTRADVLRRFPAARSDNSYCSPGQRISKEADGEYLCEHLLLARYDVAGIPLHIIFVFRSDGILAFAILQNSFRANDGKSHIAGDDLFRLFHTLYEPLKLKYGEAIHHPPCEITNSISGPMYKLCAVWQPTNTSHDWSSGRDEIELGVDCFWSPSGSYSGSLNISYKFIDRTAAGRL